MQKFCRANSALYPFRWSSFPGLIDEGQFRSPTGPVQEEVAMVLYRIAVVSAFALSATAVLAQTAIPQQGREIPAYTLPVPEDISPQIRGLVAAPPAPWDIHPKSITEWKELVAKVAAPAKTLLPAMREKLGVKLEQA